ncbi:efflux RND transporter periplasmic adaptor subunit [Nocardioides sp. R-C-SC26]|uniref:efflux RND transporter periplasmic adaptor subunit n=1 Tax=Nocardioides sp. R-C-SC26 TaxID=2870414 RepID=UPI001E29A514|nr:HlyD family efflux transporter periplasmic adaptor subunit [Nocardioides sp. R-C-SC26]
MRAAPWPAATLARDQAAIDSAHAALVAARQAVAGGVVRAARSGRIVSLDIGVGDDVSAGAAVGTVVGGGVSTVATTASLTQVPDLAVGQSASVTVVGSVEDHDATLTYVSAVPQSTEGTGYTVVITLDERWLGIPEGVGASVDIVVDQVEDAVTVPLSAVSDQSVSVIDGHGLLARRAVTLGLVGDRRVEVREGLEDGEQVVLADLDAALPSGDNPLNGFGSGPNGGFSGGGRGPGVMAPRSSP